MKRFLPRIINLVSASIVTVCVALIWIYIGSEYCDIPNTFFSFTTGRCTALGIKSFLSERVNTLIYWFIFIYLVSSFVDKPNKLEGPRKRFVYPFVIALNFFISIFFALYSTFPVAEFLGYVHSNEFSFFFPGPLLFITFFILQALYMVISMYVMHHLFLKKLKN